jgi:hypothetical protein
MYRNVQIGLIAKHNKDLRVQPDCFSQPIHIEGMELNFAELKKKSNLLKQK